MSSLNSSEIDELLKAPKVKFLVPHLKPTFLNLNSNEDYYQDTLFGKKLYSSKDESFSSSEESSELMEFKDVKAKLNSEKSLDDIPIMDPINSSLSTASSRVNSFEEKSPSAQDDGHYLSILSMIQNA